MKTTHRLSLPRALALLTLVPMLLLGLVVASPTHAAPAAFQGYLRVQVVDIVTGAAVPNAMVFVSNPASPQPIVKGPTDTSGVFMVLLPAGSYVVTVSDANYRPFTAGAVIDPGQPGPVTTLAANLNPIVSGPAPLPEPGPSAPRHAGSPIR